MQYSASMHTLIADVGIYVKLCGSLWRRQLYPPSLLFVSEQALRVILEAFMSIIKLEKKVFCFLLLLFLNKRKSKVILAGGVHLFQLYNCRKKVFFTISLQMCLKGDCRSWSAFMS